MKDFSIDKSFLHTLCTLLYDTIYTHSKHYAMDLFGHVPEVVVVQELVAGLALKVISLKER